MDQMIDMRLRMLAIQMDALVKLMGIVSEPGEKSHMLAQTTHFLKNQIKKNADLLLELEW